MTEFNEKNIFEFNKRLIEHHIHAAMTLLTANYTVEEIEVTKYSNISVNAIDFNIKQYEIKGVGNLLILDTKGSAKLQLVSIVITPYYKELPLFSSDYMYMGKERSSIIEYYDLVSEKNSIYELYMNKFRALKERHQSLEDIPSRECWYDSIRSVSVGKKADLSKDLELSTMFIDNLRLFIEMEKGNELLSKEKRKLKSSVINDYINNCINNGGVSTNLFKAAIGNDATREFFNKVFYGVDNHMNY